MRRYFPTPLSPPSHIPSLHPPLSSSPTLKPSRVAFPYYSHIHSLQGLGASRLSRRQGQPFVRSSSIGGDPS